MKRYFKAEGKGYTRYIYSEDEHSIVVTDQDDNGLSIERKPEAYKPSPGENLVSIDHLQFNMHYLAASSSEFKRIHPV